MCARLTAIKALPTLVKLLEFAVAHNGSQHISEIILFYINNT